MSLRERVAVLVLSVISITVSAINVVYADQAGWDCGAASCGGLPVTKCFNCCEDNCGDDTFGCQGFCLGEPRPPAGPSNPS
jgi:hypothetical protein